MTVNIERRTQSRKRPVSLVYVELPPSNGGMMRDLSEHGFSLRAMMPLQMSEKVPFSFHLDATARIDGEAIVVRLEDGGQVAALEFAGLSAHSRDQIRNYLEKFDEALAKESSSVKAPIQENSTFEELRSEIRITATRPKTPPLRLPLSKPAAFEPQEVRATQAEEPSPLLKLSAVRPEAANPVPEKPLVPMEEPQSVEVEAYPIPEEPPEPHSQVAFAPAPRIESPILAAPSETLPELPAALEPLSALETGAAESAPGWMDRFTLARAIGIMFLLAAVAGFFAYHRELGHALVWLGQRIAGDETSGSLQPAAAPGPAVPEAAPADSGANASPATANVGNAQVSSNSPAPESTPPKGAELSSAPENTPAPPQKDASAPSLVPLTQATRAPSASAPAPAAGEGGQQEYQQAHAILHSSSRQGELPEAVRLLWAAVEKGNVAAEITLAELYRAGRGVTRNCVQAKILLSTAARKGSADAQRRLDELQREGCAE
jgi:PilZ domain